MRKGFAALAFFAVLSALAQPVCAVQDIRLPAPQAPAVALAQDAPQGSHDRELCCAAIEVDSLVAASPAVVATAAMAMAAPLAFAHRLARTSRVQHTFGASPPPPLSYHARSARILR